MGSRNPADKGRRNNLVVLYICGGSALFTVPALLVWNSTSWLMVLGLLFWVAYLWLYLRVMRWRAPAWMITSPKRVNRES